MGSLAAALDETGRAASVTVTDEMSTVELEDGWTISVPTAWYPRLLHATKEERRKYEIDDVGVMWPDIDADFSIRGLLLGRKSCESPECFNFWLDNRRKGRRVTVEQYLKGRSASKRRGATASRQKRRAKKLKS